MKKVLLTAAAFLFALPFFVSAQAAAPVPAMQPASVSAQDQTPPAFMKDVKTAADFARLTPEQKKQVSDYMRSRITVTASDPASKAKQPDTPSGLTACFDYYHFGSVQVDLTPSVTSAVPGIPITFTGSLMNDNSYPVVDGSVYVKIFKKGGDASNTNQDGYSVVDQFFAKENISLPAKGEQPISFDWKIPAFTETGDYEVAAYFMTGKRFNLLGLPFTDDVTGNTANFSITSGESTGVSFDKNQVTLNGTPFHFAAFPPHFTKDESVTAEVSLKNTTDKPQTVNVSWVLSNWAGERAENKIDQKSESITLKAGETKVLSYETTKATGSVSFLNVTATYQDTKSVLNIRYVRDGFDETRLNFPSITEYPLTAGKQDILFSCLHSTNAPIVKDGELTLTLKDQSGNVIHTYDYQGNVTGSMMGVKDTFTPDKTYTDFTLTATLKNQGKVVEEYTDTYKCQDIDPKLCPKEVAGLPGMGGQGSAGSKGVSYLIVAVLLALLGLLGWKIRKDGGIGTGRGMKTFSLLAAMILSGTLLLGAHGVEAKSVTVTLPNWGYVDWDIDEAGNWSWGLLYQIDMGYYNSNVAMAKDTAGAWKLLTSSVQYSAQIYNADTNTVLGDGSSVAAGTHLKLVATSYQNSDINWFMSGGSSDSPYGSWNASGAYTGVGAELQLLNTGDQGYRSMVAIPPTPQYSFGGTATRSCTDAANCMVTGAGTVSASVTFPATTMNFYDNYAILHLASPIWYSPSGFISVENASPMNVAAATVSFSLTATGSLNNNPNLPSITADAANTNLAGQAQSFSFSATDPDGDNVSYDISWDGSGTVNQSLPSVASGTSESASRTWASAGTYPFKVRSHDSKGGISAWKDGSITVNAPAACSLGGTSVASGSSITAYSASTVPFGSLCSSVSESRNCFNGTLSGSFANPNCSVLTTCTKTPPNALIRGSDVNVKDPISASYISDLRKDIDTIYNDASGSNFAWGSTRGGTASETLSKGAAIRAADFLEMRDAVDKIYQQCHQTAYGGWTDDLAAGKPIRAAHVNQIREALKNAK